MDLVVILCRKKNNQTLEMQLAYAGVHAALINQEYDTVSCEVETETLASGSDDLHSNWFSFYGPS